MPLTLVSGEAVRQRIGQSLNFDLPLSSSLFTVDAGEVIAVDRDTLGRTGQTGFWRMLAVRGINAEGRPQPLGVLAAFVDASALFAAPGVSSLTVTGPMAGGITDTGNDDGSNKVEVSTGNQTFAVAFPRAQTSLGWGGWVVALLGGLIAAGTAFLAMQNENNGRKEAERRLALHKREFKKRTQELKRSEDRFRRLAESTNVIPWAADLHNGRFTYIGPQVERLCGYPAESWRARGFWSDHVHPENRRQFADRISQLKAGDNATLEYKVRSADGRVVHMRNMLTLMESRTKSGEIALVAQGYMLDITEMQTAQATLDEARRSAEQANRSKSEFLANMSHELRTPLNSVIGFAEVMKDEVFGPIGERYREYAESVHSSGKHLLSLINDVLDLSKIEAGKIELVEEETDISVLLSKCRQLLHERASHAGLHIRLEIPVPLPFVLVDGRRIKQVILNLMSNAVKFTPPGGRITLRAELIAPKGLKISVIDTGIGMTKEEVEVALEQFGQIDNELSRQHDGTGLGLPIARSLAELHGGSLGVESKKDAGTTVELWLPLSRVQSKADDKVA
jgi:PAS domain S-box-containing protein